MLVLCMAVISRNPKRVISCGACYTGEEGHPFAGSAPELLQAVQVWHNTPLCAPSTSLSPAATVSQLTATGCAIRAPHPVNCHIHHVTMRFQTATCFSKYALQRVSSDLL